jgi:hypothetical protein
MSTICVSFLAVFLRQIKQDLLTTGIKNFRNCGWKTRWFNQCWTRTLPCQTFNLSFLDMVCQHQRLTQRNILEKMINVTRDKVKSWAYIYFAKHPTLWREIIENSPKIPTYKIHSNLSFNFFVKLLGQKKVRKIWAARIDLLTRNQPKVSNWGGDEGVLKRMFQ